MIVKITSKKAIRDKDLVMPWSIFPFANLEFYGLDEEIFSLYKTGNCFFSKYDDSVQICSNLATDNELNDLSLFIKVNKIRMITGNPKIMLNLMEILRELGIILEKEDGFIFQIKKLENTNADKLILAQKESEFKDIAHVVCLANSSHTHFYKEEQLFKQYYSRSKLGYCRNFYIAFKSKVVGCVSTYCETKDYAVAGGLAVDPAFQNRGLGKSLLLEIFRKLQFEGKKVFLFCYNNKMFDFYSNISSKRTDVSKLLLK